MSYEELGQGSTKAAVEEHARPRLREKSQFPPPFLSLGILRQKTHELTHVPFCNWCEACVAGAGRSGQHRRKTDSEDGVLETTVQMDYTFFQRGANQAKVLDESVLVTVLTLVDKTSRWPLSIQVPRKGTEKSQYVLNAIELTIPQHARPQARLVRTLLMDVQKRYPNCSVDINHVVFPWMVRHAAWLTARYQVHTRDLSTPHRSINGVDPAYSREEEDVPGPPPVVAEDGMPERIDEEALVVEGVAMAEQLEEEAPMYAPDALEDEGPQHKPEREERRRRGFQVKATKHMLVPPSRSHAKGKMFHFKWVDKAKDGVHKSRLTSADVKRSYTETDKQDLRVFVPTPTPESHALLEVSALRNGYATRSFDIVAAFLIGQRAPPEWRPIFEEWVCTQPREDQHWLRDNFADLVFRLDGNLYGRRTAGSVYRDELEEILCQRLAPAFQFKRGGRDPCVYRCDKTQITLLHHVDDGRCAGPTAMLNRLIDEIIPLQAWPLECEGIAVEILGRTKTRLKDAILTALIRNTPDLSRTDALDNIWAARYRSAVGSAIYLSSDRREIAFATKELARHMASPRQCDWECTVVLGRFLQSHPDYVRVTALDASAHDGEMDFGLEVAIPRIWSDSSGGISAAKRIGPSAKLRHLDVCEFYVQ
ncbi:unnamed protein product, partial [Effrenium voratum]